MFVYIVHIVVVHLYRYNRTYLVIRVIYLYIIWFNNYLLIFSLLPTFYNGHAHLP